MTPVSQVFQVPVKRSYLQKGRGFASLCAIATLLGLSVQHSAIGQTLAYYRFEEGVSGMSVPVTPDATAPAVSPVLDYSGNGNNLRTFNASSAPTYSANVPASVVPQTGASNAGSLQMTPNQDVYSLNADTGHGANLNDYSFSAFTVEASFKLNQLNAFQGIVVRDNNTPTYPGPLPPFVIKVRGDDNRINLEMFDGSGTDRFLESAFVPLIGEWYNVAVVDDGTMVSLYVKGPGDPNYVLQGTNPITGGALANPYGVWGVGRGWFNGPADWINGNIDEVRISASALAPSQFLFSQAAVPEPGSIALLCGITTVGAGLLRRRRNVTA